MNSFDGSFRKVRHERLGGKVALEAPLNVEDSFGLKYYGSFPQTLQIPVTFIFQLHKNVRQVLEGVVTCLVL